MENVAITLEDDTLRRARIDAAKAGVTLEEYISDLVKAYIERRDAQKQALAALRALPGFPGLSEDLTPRSELYDEILFPRHEHSDLSPRSEERRKAGAGV